MRLSCVDVDLYQWLVMIFFFFRQKTAYELRISDGSSDVCSSDLAASGRAKVAAARMLWRWSSGWPGGSCNTPDLLRSEAIAEVLSKKAEIGRASCRERVCQYV